MLFHSTTLGSLYMGDCMDIIKDVADKSVDMILCDPPLWNDEARLG
jgi:site-specific DNA-methyltransferase (adenine-specific)